MNIKCIRTHHVRCNLDNPFGFSQWYYDQRNVLIVEIIADNGVTGWGECYGPAAVIEAAIEKFYASKILGMNILSTEAIWHFMWRASLDFSRSGIMMAAMSGIDMALWDAKGKALNQSVGQLMGGSSRDKVPCYATGMYFRDLPEDNLLEVLVDEALSYAKQGFKAMKIKIGKNPNFDEKLIVAMRKALPKTILAADSNHAYDLPEAIKIARILDDNDYAWFEEPLSPEHPDLFTKLHEKSNIAIATGECEQTRYGFQRLISAGGVQLIQADLGYCGGISEALKIRAIASSNGLNMIPHVWGTQLNLAAATHFLSTSYSEPGRAEEKPLFLEYDRTENPLRDELYTTNVEVLNGHAIVPKGVGLGVEIDAKRLKEFTVKQTETVLAEG
ncbi:mandelate racemase/muconate lactonizing enzyme family protein [Aliiglaciecola sp. 2_MG-2023]|uniref:mandelate racemase/muconate lactonizing enzyme family protein n=1 Tax=unclassified Aliiglaciecola TaxID=2593648 RepID=UPI0026E2645C|nr:MULTISPECIES: mandelate racemase/muconate lactonizing enzyme family protein [unclassified Aliiglaciecola]MDO6710663.1 mandelate racemase/muconate lactonizing enzyme family protein [Aliiglaciecola sp. 2_MG-2023]MDO6751929.1 mandelate racemase/muconate lactonizing enzyme family protein [Aliiglaciecola sp. 1_MG-2023]